MSKKNNRNTVNKESVEKQDNINDIVYVRVARNFNDATDNERFISAGPNCYYKTNKNRADMLVKAGYAEYDDEVNIVNANAKSEDTSVDDTNANAKSEDTNVDDTNVNDENNIDIEHPNE